MNKFYEEVDKIEKNNEEYEYFEIEEDCGEISLCTLSAVNWGKISKPEDFEEPCELIVRALDAILSYQDYPVAEAQRHTTNYRPLGVGITNMAYWLAKNGLTYEADQETLDKVALFAEAWSYYLLKTSVQLAKEFGTCQAYNNTKYSLGQLPVDHYKKEVDELTKHKTHVDWESLRKEMKENGIRNSTLMACMPAETSAQISNSTNGIEPPRGFISSKESKSGTLRQVVPSFPKLKNKYQLAWDLKSPLGYLKIVAVLQKYMDQTISTNTYYNPENYPDRKVSMKDMISHLLFCYKYGITTLYYNNTNDGSGKEEKEMAGQVDSNVVQLKDNKSQDGCVDGCML